MPTLTTFTLLRDLTTIGITAPAGSGGHHIIPITNQEWIGVASADSALTNLIAYRTTDAFTTLAVTATVAEPSTSTIATAFARSGTTVVLPVSENAPAPDSAAIYRSANTGLTYALAQNIGAGGFRRPYALLKMSNGTWFTGLGQSPAPTWWTSVDDAVTWVDQGVFGGEGANRQFAGNPIQVTGFGTNRLLVSISDRYSILGANNVTVYTAESFGTGATTARLTGLGLLTPWPCCFFQSASGTCFASIPKGVADDAIYRSTDGGETWAAIVGTPLAAGNFAEIGAILCVPKNGATPGIYTSTDDGLTWSTIALSGVSTSFQIHAAPDNSKFYLAAMSGTAGGGNAHPLVLVSNDLDPGHSETETIGLGLTDTILVSDLGLKYAWSVWPNQNAVSLWRVRDPSTGIEEVFAGGRDGNVRVLNRPSTTNAYTATVRHTSALGVQGIEKSGRHLFLYFKEQGSYTVAVRVYWDFATTATVDTTVSLLGNGSVWGTFVWGTGVWGAQSQIIKRVDLRGTGEFMTLEIENADAGERFTFLGYEVLFRSRRLVRR